MIYFWLIPLALLLFLAVMLMFRNGTKKPAGRSRLDEARDS
jgi:hypothetical protein